MKQVFRRSFQSELTLRDGPDDQGRIVTGKIFPFGEPAHVREVIDGVVQDYTEEFLPGCTLRMRQLAEQRTKGIPAWIRLTLDHESGFDREVGRARSLSESDDGAWATFRLYEGRDLEKVRSMLAESHGGLSVEFVDHVSPIVEGNHVKRRQILVNAVTATPIPMYASAGITEMRSDEATELVGTTPHLDAVNQMLAELRR